MRSCRAFVSAATVAMFVASLAAWGPIALAASGFDGNDATSTTSYIGGGGANISYDNPDETQQYGAAAWAGVGESTSGGPGLVQAGWAKLYTFSCAQGFVEAIDSSNVNLFTTYTGSCWSSSGGNGEVLVANATWSSSSTLSSGTWYLYLNYSAYGSATLSQLGWNDPETVAQVGELHDTAGSADQSPGAENSCHTNPVEFSSVLYYNGSSSKWVQPYQSIISSLSQQQYSFSSYSSSDLFYIWDNTANCSFQ